MRLTSSSNGEALGDDRHSQDERPHTLLCVFWLHHLRREYFAVTLVFWDSPPEKHQQDMRSASAGVIFSGHSRIECSSELHPLLVICTRYTLLGGHEIGSRSSQVKCSVRTFAEVPMVREMQEELAENSFQRAYFRVQSWMLKVLNLESGIL